MPVTPEEVTRKHPQLYHMAASGSWENIKKAGLLSTSQILNGCEISAEKRSAIESRIRRKSYLVQHKLLGEITIRDQKPLTAKLEKCLVECTVEEWLLMLNRRVFFWASEDRLKRFMRAKEYRDKEHCVIVVDTGEFLAAHKDCVKLTHMNTGAVEPFSHQRGPKSFIPLNEFPLQGKKRKRVVEVSVEGGVRKIQDYVIRVENVILKNDRLEILKRVYVK